MGDRNWLIEINLVFVWGSKMTFVLSVWIEIKLFFGVEPSKLTWIWSGDRNWIDFSGGSKLAYFFREDWISLGFGVVGRNWLDLRAGDWTLLDLSVWTGIDLVFVSGSKILRFNVWININLVFVSGRRSWLDFGVGIEMTLCRGWSRN